jgi:glycosyltransferase involved in cell wall biosynthesis
LPSGYEAWALVINEAVAAGVAVVASDVVGAAYELVRDGVNGRIFRSGDLESLTQALFDATDETNNQTYRRSARGVLDDWRRVADPVRGFERAFMRAGVIDRTPS